MDVTFSTHLGKHDSIISFTYEEISTVEKAFNKDHDDFAAEARDRNEFSGKHKECIVATGKKIRFNALVGLGKKKDVTTAKLREAAGDAARKLRDMGAKKLAVKLPGEMDAGEVAQAATEGVILATYRYTKKTDTSDLKELETVTIVSDRTGVAAKNGTDVGKKIAAAVNMTRDLQNAPPSELYPAKLAAAASKIAKKYKLKIKTLDTKALEKQGYGGILAVGRGSAHGPRLVTIEYAPKKSKKKIALVGKGITFDTGGLSLKPSNYMLGMKFDMSGAATVLGIMQTVAELKLPVKVIGVLGLAENAVSGDSYKPDDVVVTKSGKTIEIQNTDAEGRIVLSDALHHATLEKPDEIIDFATLTGACVVALGNKAAAVLGTDDAIIKGLQDSSCKSGELIWQLPLWDSYKEDIDSKIADMKNMGFKREAGTIAAAMLLRQFVGDTPWAHLDIAGVAWADPRDCYFTKGGEGGTGFGVRLVTEYLRA